MLTRELMGRRQIQGERRGRKWVFWADESPAVQLIPLGRASRAEERSEARERLSPRAFEELAQVVMSEHFGGPSGIRYSARCAEEVRSGLPK